MAGVSRQQYASDIKIVRVMCTGRVDLSFIFRALLNGKDGVFIGGCWPGECHYLTQGNFGALSMMHMGRKLLEMIGVNPERLRLEYISASEGGRYAEVMNDFSKTVREAGPLGEEEGIDETVLRRKLEVVYNLVPYIKLVERERLRVPEKSVAAYNDFYTSDTFNRLFRELIKDKFEISQIMALLREKPCSAKEISESLGQSTSEISRHLNASARQGLGRYDESQNLISATYNKSTDPMVKKNNENVRTSALDNEKIEQIISKHQGKAGSLIHVLMEIQSINHWLPKEILNKISEKLEVPLTRVMQIATFYKTFSLTPKGRHEIHVCTGTSCHLRGSSHLLNKVQDLIGIRPGETDSDSKFSLGNGNCLGCCTLGPEIIVDGKHHSKVTPAMAEDVLKTYE